MPSQAAAIRQQLEAATAKAVLALTLEVDANLRRSADAGGTPVDTGHARANWVPSVGQPYIGEANSDGDHEAGIQALLSYTLANGPAWVSNNVPYITLLDLGFSPQAPAGFVEMAIAQALVSVQQKFDNVDMGAAAFLATGGGVAAGNLAAAYMPEGLP